MAEPEIKLTDTEIDKLREEARLQVIKERKKQLQDEMRKELYAQERAKLDPEEGVVDLLINVPAVNVIDPLTFEAGVSVDGVRYVNGRTYTIPKKRADLIRQMMAGAWQIEERAGSPNRDMNVTRIQADARNGARQPLPRVVSV